MKIPDSFLNCGYFLDKNFKAITKFQWLICNYWYLESESAEWYPFIVHVFIVIIVISVNCLWWFCCWFHSKLICCVWHRWCDEKMCAVLDTCNCLSFLQQLSAMLNLIHVTINLTLKCRQGPFAIGDNNKVFDVVSMSSEMGCIVINVTVHTWRQKKHIVDVKYEWALTASQNTWSTWPTFSSFWTTDL